LQSVISGHAGLLISPPCSPAGWAMGKGRFAGSWIRSRDCCDVVRSAETLVSSQAGSVWGGAAHWLVLLSWKFTPLL